MLSAGRDILGQAAELGARDTSGGAITLEAAIDEQSARTYQESNDGIDYFSVDARSQQQSLSRTTLSGQDVEIKSGGDTTLAAVSVNAQRLDIDAKGKLIVCRS